MRRLQIRELSLGTGKPKICVSIAETAEGAILDKARLLKNKSVDLIEWRVDAFEGIDDAEAVKQVLVRLRALLEDFPLIFTVRTKEEGGLLSISDEAYGGLLIAVARWQLADLIDVEMRLAETLRSEVLQAIKSHKGFVIGSKHDFNQTPSLEALVRMLESMEAAGADVVKLACMPQSKTDVLNLLLATQLQHDKPGNAPIVTMSMGALGQISRLVGGYSGSALTFAAEGEVSAPGQPSVETLKKALDLLALIEN